MGEDEFLEKAAEQARQGDPHTLTVEELLGKFGEVKRSYRVVSLVTRRLYSVGLQARPDIRPGALDKEVRLCLISPESEGSADGSVEVALKVRDLPSATNGLEYVRPQTSLAEAITIMMLNDFSQLAVFAGERDLRGYVSWTSLGKAHLNGGRVDIESVMTPDATSVSTEDDLLPLLPQLAERGFVFVTDKRKKPAGIITTSDLTLFLDELAQPFLLIGEMERALRQFVQRHFELNELKAGLEDGEGLRKVHSFDDLTIGQVARFLESEENWKRLSWPLDRRTFVDRLHDVRALRNDLMHFAPVTPTAEDFAMVRHLTATLRMALQKWGPSPEQG